MCIKIFSISLCHNNQKKEKMRNKKQTTNVEFLGVKLIAEFEIDGQYFPATREQPEEYPEIILHDIKAEDSNISLMPLLELWYEDIVLLLEQKEL